MKRFLITFAVFILLPVVVLSAEKDEYNSYLDAYDLSSFSDTLDKDTYSYLKELGIDGFDFERISSLNLKDIASIIESIIKGRIETPVSASASVLAFIILSSVLQGIKSTDDSSFTSTYSTAASLIIAVILLVKISSAISLSVAALGIAAGFIYAFIPAFCAITVASGGISTMFSTNAMLLLLSQGLSFLASNILIPVINCFLAVSICSGLKKEMNLSLLTSSIKRTMTSVISFISAAFVSILSIKTAIASKADILGIRSIRLVINTVVPIIGSSISEGLLSIQGYSSLIKSSVGVVGIIAIALVFIPSIIEIAIWRITLSFSQIIANVFDNSATSDVLNAFKDTLLLINVVLVFSMLTSIISFGILIAARTA